MNPVLRRQLGRFATVLLIAGIFFGSASSVAFAGFGITPPYVENSRLTRGSVYEQRITLVRSDPDIDLEARITMNVPEMESWISIDRGEVFTLPAGARQVPIVVTVRVPDDAEYKRYRGAIRVRTSAPEAPEGGGVSIALGAQIEVDLEVVDRILDFNVRRVQLASMEEGYRKWGLFFPGKIRFFITFENIGNAEYGPTKVQFEIYDRDMETLLEVTENTNKIEQIPPFATQEVVAELPTRLPVGSYVAKYTIYKGDTIAQQNTVNLRISALGSVPGYEGYGFEGLSMGDKAKVAAALGTPVLLILVPGAFIVRQRSRRERGESPEADPLTFS